MVTYKYAGSRPKKSVTAVQPSKRYSDPSQAKDTKKNLEMHLMKGLLMVVCLAAFASGG